MTHISYQYPIILASESPARHQLLTSVGIEHLVKTPEIDEELHKPQVKHFSIADQAHHLAQLKAESISLVYPDYLVIAADQIGEFNGIPFFKPQTKENNIRLLQQLNGHQHRQHTVTVLYLNGKEYHHIFSMAALTMRALTHDEITAYVEHDQPWGCCGGYRFEGLGKHLFSHINGEADSILGLPLVPLLTYLYAQGYLQLKIE